MFQGKTFGVGDRALRRPENWKHLVNPFKPSWGEPYVDQVVRMMGALDAAKDAARGHEAVLVSHQLPIWIVRSFVEKRRLWHDPRKRQCTLASLTSFTYRGDRIISVGYSEPARDLVPAHLLAGAKPVKGKGKALGVKHLHACWRKVSVCVATRTVLRKIRPTLRVRRNLSACRALSLCVSWEPAERAR